jgi:ribonuclease HI
VRHLDAWFDGATGSANPGGHASWGAIIKHDNRAIWKAHGYVGHGPEMSNNVAEYCGLISVLAFLYTNRESWSSATVHGDSKLVVMQMNGKWGAYGGLYYPYYETAKAGFESLRDRIKLKWVPREKNGEADELSKLELRARLEDA